MRKVVVSFAIVVFLVHAPIDLAKANLAEEVKVSMKSAATFFRSISTNGGYAGIYSLDLKDRYGEAFYEKAGKTEIWVQPPGTPSIGQCYLRAWRITGDKYYLDATREVAKALVWGQREIGGWDHRVDVAHLKPGKSAPIRRKGLCTFDDDITQGALKFLIDADSILDEAWLTDAIELGLGFMQKSQFDNGAWPQWYPLRGGYHNHYTYNDHAINDCIAVMLKAHATYDRPEYLAAAESGGDFIILSQLPKPQAGWAQQYSHDMKPAWARSFEPPGVCSAVTANNIRTLVQLYVYTKKDKYLSPVPAAIEWLEGSKISDNLWARLYEVGTNRPIYGDRMDGHKVHYDYEKVSQKERSSYGWQGEYGITSAISQYRRHKAAGKNDARPDKSGAMSEESRIKRATQLEPTVERIIGALDNGGRWVANDVITCQTFVSNFMTLCNYLELQSPPKK
ncbi:MAG: pectate lyase [Planctomycetota bacterium]